MRSGVKRGTVVGTPRVLVGSPSATFARQIGERLKDAGYLRSITCATTLERLREAARLSGPEVIVIEDRLFACTELTDPVTEFTAIAPVLLVADYNREPEVARLVAAGQIDFVPRANQWALLAASLVERRLRSAENANVPIANAVHFNEDLGEIFRHEINNPLTGILGNAELLLAHSDRFPPTVTQRIRTVVELAVRLREAVRRVSNAWDEGPHSRSGDVRAEPFIATARASERL